MTEIENGTERMAAVISNRRLGSASSEGEGRGRPGAVSEKVNQPVGLHHRPLATASLVGTGNSESRLE
jgi:hypothetical protein